MTNYKAVPATAPIIFKNIAKRGTINAKKHIIRDIGILIATLNF